MEEEPGISGNGQLENDLLPYRWTQTLSDVNIEAPIPVGTRGKQLEIIIKSKSIKLAVQVAGVSEKRVIRQGEIFAEIDVDESTWTVENQDTCSIHLEKRNKQQWWPHVWIEDPKIDVQKIKPENSKLSDLDGETRGMVEKMMFDNQQRQLGKPTSDELKKQQVLQNFMAQHPEMDFSKVKMT